MPSPSALNSITDLWIGVFVVTGALVGQRDRQTPVEECHLLQAPVDGLEAERRGLEDLPVRPERNRGSGVLRLRTLVQRSRLTVQVLLRPDEPILVDVDVHPDG